MIPSPHRVQPLHIRPLTAADLDAALDVDRRALGGLWSLDGYRRELDSPNSDLLGLWVATGEVEPRDSASAEAALCLVGLGCAWAILDEYHITLLAIAPDWQRQGLGRALLLALLWAARDRQMVRATLEVRVSNGAARSLYGEFGFREAGIRKNYYAATGEDAAILWRSGLDDPRQRDQWAVWLQRTRDRLRQSGWDWCPAIGPT
jgi:ribosomal-protein-alanine N-acetyltransferase